MGVHELLTDGIISNFFLNLNCRFGYDLKADFDNRHGFEP